LGSGHRDDGRSPSECRIHREINEFQKADFLGNARALLFPICWPEPFGLVMIEAMACGTPVIALAHGSVEEVIDHGVSGFVASSVDEAVAAAKSVGTLERQAIRARFEQRFTAERMARDYLAAYRRLPALQQAPQLDMLAIPASEDAIRMPIPSASLEVRAVSAA
jgi:glycosyltransferase involved in cell wall biosynthesis